jgi:type I restriction enzyme S subunit
MKEGRVFPSDDYTTGGVRLLRPGNLGPDGSISWDPTRTKNLPISYADANPELLCRSGDLVINLTAQSLEDAFIGRVCLLRDGDDSLLNQRQGRFDCGSRILPEFLFRVCQTERFRRWVEARCEGTKIRHLYWRHLEPYELSLPPLSRQVEVIARCREVDQAAAAVSAQVNSCVQLGMFLGEELVNRSTSS